MSVLVKNFEVKAVGSYEGNVYELDIQLVEGTEEEQLGQIFEAIANYSNQLERMDESIDPLFIEWVVN